MTDEKEWEGEEASQYLHCVITRLSTLGHGSGAKRKTREGEKGLGDKFILGRISFSFFVPFPFFQFYSHLFFPFQHINGTENEFYTLESLIKQ